MDEGVGGLEGPWDPPNWPQDPGTTPGLPVGPDLQAQIETENEEIAREEARLKGVGPIQYQQLLAQIASRRQRVEFLERQLHNQPQEGS
jgi:hypothetical protein